jgi:hypothetical protein
VALKLAEVAQAEELATLASEALASMDDTGLPAAARQLTDRFRADRVVLLAAPSNGARLVAFDVGNGSRQAARAPDRVANLTSAQQAARALVGEVNAGRGTARGPDDGARTEVRASPVKEDSVSDAGPGDPSSDEDTSWDAAPAAVTPPASGSGGFGLLSSDPTKEVVLLATYGTGAALAAAGGVFGYLALAAQDEYYLETGESGAEFDEEKTTNQVEGEEIKATGQRHGLVADILYGAAAVAVITGLVLHLAWDPAPPAAATATALAQPGQSVGPVWTFELGPGYLRLEF